MPAGLWYHLTVNANARKGPGVSYPSDSVQKAGHNFRTVGSKKDAAGHTWLKTDHGVWYRSDLTKPGKATRVGERPDSPILGGSPRPSYPYGVRDSRYQAGFHTGADWAASTGTAIVAVQAGKVVRGGAGGSLGGAYGKWIVIDAGAGKHQWLYAHMSVRKAKLGQHVKAGQVIGYVGATGNVTGPHLHLECSRGGYWSYGAVINPVGAW